MSFFNKISNKNIKEDQEFLVIGAGRFGSSVAKTLHSLGYQVLLVDKNPNKLNNIDEEVTQTIIADATDEKALTSIDVRNFDVAIVAIGNDLNSSILTTLMLKEHGAKKVICKAVTEIQARTLYKLGADNVIFPERDTGIRVAQNLVTKNILDRLDLDPNISIFEITTPSNWIGKSLIDLNLREQFNINVLAIKRNESIDITPKGDSILESDDILLLIGQKSILLEINKK